jgi:hypothetical protein
MSLVATIKGLMQYCWLIDDANYEKWFCSNRKSHKTIKWLKDIGICYAAASPTSFAKEMVLKHVTKPVTSPQGN